MGFKLIQTRVRVLVLILSNSANFPIDIDKGEIEVTRYYSSFTIQIKNRPE